MACQPRAWLYFGMLALLLVGPLASPALAADDDAEGPWLDVPNLPWQTAWVQWLVGAAFAGACIAVAFKNPHRSHLD